MTEVVDEVGGKARSLTVVDGAVAVERGHHGTQHSPEDRLTHPGAAALLDGVAHRAPDISVPAASKRRPISTVAGGRLASISALTTWLMRTS